MLINREETYAKLKDFFEREIYAPNIGTQLGRTEFDAIYREVHKYIGFQGVDGQCELLDAVDMTVGFWNEYPPVTEFDFETLYLEIFDGILFSAERLYQKAM